MECWASFKCTGEAGIHGCLVATIEKHLHNIQGCPAPITKIFLNAISHNNEHCKTKILHCQHAEM